MKKITSKFTSLAIAGIVLIAVISVESCSKSSSGPAVVTPIGGFVSSDSVEASSLIAYWPFDGDANDHKGGLNASAVGTITYGTGIRGKAYQGDSGVYSTFALPTGGGNFANLGSFSISFWYNLPKEDTSTTQGVFFLSGANTQDELVLELEPYKAASLDSVKIHTGFNDLGSPAFKLFIPESFDTLAINAWVHFVVTYNGGTSVYTVYQDAVPSGTNTAFSPNTPPSQPYPYPGYYNTPNTFYTDGSKATLLGNLNFSSDPPTTINVGTWPNGLFGQVSGKDCFLGRMDELRVFNIALTQQDVSGLYLNGLAGR